MSDLETRLDESLAGTAARAPHPTDLAVGARNRLRRRRRTTAAVVAAAVVVVAIPVTVSVVSGGGSGGVPDSDDSTVADSLPADWRTETWHDLSVTVPPDWTYGGGSDWCTSGRGVEATTPQVSRPAGVIPAIACSPSYGYGAHFLQPSRRRAATRDRGRRAAVPRRALPRRRLDRVRRHAAGGRLGRRRGPDHRPAGARLGHTGRRGGRQRVRHPPGDVLAERQRPAVGVPLRRGRLARAERAAVADRQPVRSSMPSPQRPVSPASPTPGARRS